MRPFGAWRAGLALCVGACGSTNVLVPPTEDGGPAPIATTVVVVVADATAPPSPPSPPPPVADGGASGTRDPSFATGGELTFDFGASADTARVVATQPDGKIVVAGGIQTPEASAAVARYDADGSLDASFGMGGKVFIPTNSSITGMALQGDGKIVVTTDWGFHVVRLDADGSIDPGFNRSEYIDFTLDAPYLASAEGVAVQPDGKLVIVGTAAQGADEQMIVMRLNADGTNDNTFGNVGAVTIPVPGIDSLGASVGLVTNGSTTTSIVVSGYTASSDTVAAFDLTVARLNATDGSLDTSFGGTGFVTAVADSFGDVAPLVVQSDGKIVVGGTYYGLSSQAFVVTRFDTNGALDTTFDGDGMMLVPCATSCKLGSIALQSDGKIAMLGTAFGGSPSFASFVVARVSSDGALDASFNGTGSASFDFGVVSDVAYGMTLDANQNILVVGSTKTGTDIDFALARITSAGVVDAKFTTAMGSGDDVINASALAGDGSLIVAGYAYDGTATDVLVAKITPAGGLDPSFGKGGIVASTMASYASGVAIQDDGKVVVVAEKVLARFLANGDIDSSFGANGQVALLDSGTAVAIRNGDIFVSGEAFAVEAFDANGEPLGTFNGGTTAPTTFSGDTYANATALDANGNVVVAGGIYDPSNAADPSDVAIARYSSQGALDATFGTNGLGRFDLAPTDDVRAVGIQTDGKIVTGGLVDAPSSGGDFVVARWLANGAIDPSFNGSGHVTIDLDGYDALNALVIQPDGKIVAAGSASASGVPARFALVRYSSDGTLDATFADTGTILTALGVGAGGAETLVQRPSGRLIASGYLTTPRQDKDAVILQYWP